MSVQEIIEAAMRLPSEDRERLGEALLESVNPEWNELDLTDAELTRRLEEMKSDSSKRVPLQTAFPELGGAGRIDGTLAAQASGVRV